MKQNESEDDRVGAQILGPHKDENGDEIYVVHGGTLWRPPWDY